MLHERQCTWNLNPSYIDTVLTSRLGTGNSRTFFLRCRVPSLNNGLGPCGPALGLAISDKKNSAEDEIERTIDLFRRNSGCSAEQKTLEILFQTFLQRREMLGILYRGTKIKANSRNSILNHSTEVKTARNSVPWNKNRSKHLEFCSEPFRGRKTTQNCVPRNKNTRRKANSQNSVHKYFADKNKLSIMFAGPGFLYN
jgi:hypothetical protein